MTQLQNKDGYGFAARAMALFDQKIVSTGATGVKSTTLGAGAAVWSTLDFLIQPGAVCPTASATATATATVATATPTPSASATPTMTPTPACTPDFNASIYLLNQNGNVMNGMQSTTPGFTRGNPYFPFLVVNAVGPAGLLTSFTGTPSGLLETPTITARFVDNSGFVCQGTDSATPAQFTATFRACSSEGFVIPCNESATVAPSNPPTNQPYNLTVTIIDSNGFVDDTF
jgi:hypothetical protein